MATRNRSFARLAPLLDASGDLTSDAIASDVTIGIDTYDSIGLLPYSNNTAGDQALITSTGRMYIHSGQGWYNIALINRNPSIVSILNQNGDSNFSTLSENGIATTITITATDSDGDLLTYSAVGDSNFNNMASISQDSSVFTISPFNEQTATATSGVVTFSVTDGINQIASDKNFTLVFHDWTNLTDSTGEVINLTSLDNSSFKSWNSDESTFYTFLQNGFNFGTIWKTESSPVGLNGFRVGNNSFVSDSFVYWIYHTPIANGISGLLSGTLLLSRSPTISMNNNDHTYLFGFYEPAGPYTIPANSFFIIIITSLAAHTWTTGPGYNIQYNLNGVPYLRQISAAYYKNTNTGFTNDLEAPSQVGGSASYTFVNGASSRYPRLYPIITTV